VKTINILSIVLFGGFGILFYSLDILTNNNGLEVSIEELEENLIEDLRDRRISSQSAIILDLGDTVYNNVIIQNGICSGCEGLNFERIGHSETNLITSYRYQDILYEVNQEYTYVLRNHDSYILVGNDTVTIKNKWVSPRYDKGRFDNDQEIEFLDSIQISASVDTSKFLFDQVKECGITVDYVEENKYKFLIGRTIFYEGIRTNFYRMSMRGKLIIKLAQIKPLNDSGFVQGFVFQEY
jgi:hypothetical protein